MPAVSRQVDSLSTGHACTGSTVLDTPGQSTVRVTSILDARVSDPTVSHPLLNLVERRSPQPCLFVFFWPSASAERIRGLPPPPGCARPAHPLFEVRLPVGPLWEGGHG